MDRFRNDIKFINSAKLKTKNQSDENVIINTGISTHFLFLQQNCIRNYLKTNIKLTEY